MKVSCLECKDKSCAVSLLNNTELEVLSGNSSEIFLKKGELLYKEGALSSNIIYLKAGLVKEFTTGVNKKEQIIQIIKSRSYLGLSSMFGNKMSLYSYSVLEDSKICYIDSEVFKNLIQTNGMFSYEILVSVCRENINNYHRCLNKSIKQMYGRFADALIYFSKVIYESDEFDLPVTQTELAALIGATRESITRMFTKFKNEGIIDAENRKVKILKPDLLENISRKG
jgi:CRP/FNR family transcriptional regulator